MKKVIEFMTYNLDPYSALNFANDVLKKWGTQADWQSIRQFEAITKKNKVIAKWGNKKCGIKHTFQKLDNYWDSYKIHAIYELFGLNGKNSVTIERLYETARFKEESKTHFIIRIKGDDAFCRFIDEAVVRDFEETTIIKA